jgi:hypothetical protein
MDLRPEVRLAWAVVKSCTAAMAFMRIIVEPEARASPFQIE